MNKTEQHLYTKKGITMKLFKTLSRIIDKKGLPFLRYAKATNQQAEATDGKVWLRIPYAFHEGISGAFVPPKDEKEPVQIEEDIEAFPSLESTLHKTGFDFAGNEPVKTVVFNVQVLKKFALALDDLGETRVTLHFRPGDYPVSFEGKNCDGIIMPVIY